MTAATRVPSAAAEPIRALFRCDGATVPTDVEGGEWDVDAALTSGGEEADLHLRIDGDEPWGRSPLEGRAADLLRIAAFAYGADQQVSRGGQDVHRERWRRRMTLAVPVSDPAFWSAPATVGALAAALTQGTEDTWGFVFAQRTEPRERVRMEFGPPRALTHEVVVLFSGGVDSTCALVEALAAGALPTAVSHRSTPPADSLQQAVLGGIRERFRGAQINSARFWIHRKGADATDTSQRTRGFLFAALGLAVAARAGIGRVLLPDNGYVSVNPAINDQLVGALASRGTHPIFLREVNRLAALAFPDGPQVENPLADRTRAQALEILKDHGLGPLVGRTRSCGKHRGRSKHVPHCGGCSQCVDRRFAVIAAGLDEHDPAERYGVDVFRGPLPATGEGRTIPVSYVRFAKETDGKDGGALFAEHEELIGCLDATRRDVPEQAEALARVLAAHAAEVIGVMGTMLGRHGEEVMRGTLGQPNLLQLFAGPSAGAGEPTAGWDDDAAPSAGPVAVAEPPPNRLVRRGRRWHVEFRGAKGVVDDSVGLGRVARIVKAGRGGLFALDLVQGSTPGERRPTRRDDEPAESVDEVHADAPPRRTVRPRVAPGTDIQARARELQERLEEADPNGDEYPRIVAELDVLAERWAQEQGAAGVGPDKHAHERARTAVANSVRWALQRIEEPELASFRAHLTDHLHAGLRCRYDPRPPERWVVDLGDRPATAAEVRPTEAA